MNKMTRNIIIMVILIALAVGAILLMPLLKPEDKPIDLGPTPDPKELAYSSYKTDDVKEVTLRNDKGELTLFIDENDSLWKAKGMEGVELDQTKSRGIAYTAAAVYAEQKVTDDMSRKAEFGLENAAATVGVLFNDGVEHTYYLGDKTPDNKGYYMLMDGVDEIFTVWTNYGMNALYTLNDLRKLGKLDIAIEEISRFIIKNRSEEYEIGISNETDRVSVYKWEMIEPYQRAVNIEPLEALLTDMAEVSVSGVVEGDVKDFSPYGLDKPWGRIYMERADGHSNEILFGSDIDDSTVHCRFSGDSAVYSIRKSKLQFMETSAWQLSDKMLALMMVTNVDSINLSLPNTEAVLDVNHVKKLDEDGNEKLDGNGNPSFDNIYSLDQVELSDEKKTIDDVEYESPQKQAVYFYQALIGLKINSVLGDPDFVGKKVAASIEYTILNCDGHYNITFYEYNSDFYAAKINDQDDYYLIFTRDIEELEGKLDLLRKGRLERDY